MCQQEINMRYWILHEIHIPQCMHHGKGSLERERERDTRLVGSMTLEDPEIQSMREEQLAVALSGEGCDCAAAQPTKSGVDGGEEVAYYY